jgi:transcription termination factor Rho
MPEETIGTGILEILPNGSGLLRAAPDFEPSPGDAYVAPAQIRRFNLRPGHSVTGPTRAPRGGERHRSLLKVEAVEGRPPEEAAGWPDFATLTAEAPTVRLYLERGHEPVSMRVVDLLAPIGKGQRGLIVAPPFAGKTRFLTDVAGSVAARYPDMVLLLLLVDERPEEVTDMRRAGAGQVIASSFDSDATNHIRVAELTLARAQRLVEAGRDVFLLLDSLTRLGRASNMALEGPGRRGDRAPGRGPRGDRRESGGAGKGDGGFSPPRSFASGRTLSGGLDPAALRFPRRMFGAARAVAGGGSLTLLATALVETGSRLDDLIFEEFKGTGNWELRLDRKLAERRLFPAVDVGATGARGEERLYTPDELRAAHLLRRILQEKGRTPDERLARLLASLEKTADNAELLRRLLAGQTGGG